MKRCFFNKLIKLYKRIIRYVSKCADPVILLICVCVMYNVYIINSIMAIAIAFYDFHNKHWCTDGYISFLRCLLCVKTYTHG